jgi:hypothetical protein
MFLRNTRHQILALIVTSLLGFTVTGLASAASTPYWIDSAASTQVDDGHWVLTQDENGFVTWDTNTHKTQVAHFSCPSSNEGLDIIGDTITTGGVLYAVLAIGAEKVGSEMPGWTVVGPTANTNQAICGAVGQAFNPTDDQETESWVDPANGEQSAGFYIIISSTDDGSHWSFAGSSVEASVGPTSLFLHPKSKQRVLLTAEGEGVRFGSSESGFATFTPQVGWSSVTNIGQSFGFNYLAVQKDAFSLEPGVASPNGYVVGKTRGLSDGSVWTLWQEKERNNEEQHVVYPVVITSSKNGHETSQIKTTPVFRRPAVSPGMLVSPGCSIPSTAPTHGLETALASESGQTVYGTTPRYGSSYCHSRFTTYDKVPVTVGLLVSHNAGRRWQEVRVPHGLWVGEVLAVEGTSPVVGFESGGTGHAVCHASGLLYERLVAGRWQKIGCRNTNTGQF